MASIASLRGLPLVKLMTFSQMQSLTCWPTGVHKNRCRKENVSPDIVKFPAGARAKFTFCHVVEFVISMVMGAQGALRKIAIFRVQVVARCYKCLVEAANAWLYSRDTFLCLLGWGHCLWAQGADRNCVQISPEIFIVQYGIYDFLPAEI